MLIFSHVNGYINDRIGIVSQLCRIYLSLKELRFLLRMICTHVLNNMLAYLMQERKNDQFPDRLLLILLEILYDLNRIGSCALADLISAAPQYQTVVIAEALTDPADIDKVLVACL